MQVEVVWHHGRPDDADRDIQGGFVRQGGNEAGNDLAQVRFRQDHLRQKTESDNGDQRQNERLDLPDAEVQQEEEQKGVQHREENAIDQR